MKLAEIVLGRSVSPRPAFSGGDNLGGGPPRHPPEAQACQTCSFVVRGCKGSNCHRQMTRQLEETSSVSIVLFFSCDFCNLSPIPLRITGVIMTIIRHHDPASKISANFTNFHAKIPASPASLSTWPILSTLAPKWAALTLNLCTQHRSQVSHLHVPRQNSTNVPGQHKK